MTGYFFLVIHSNIKKYRTVTVTVTVTLGKSVRTIGYYAFYNCKNLICIYFYGETAPTIVTNAFDGIEEIL